MACRVASQRTRNPKGVLNMPRIPLWICDLDARCTQAILAGNKAAATAVAELPKGTPKAARERVARDAYRLGYFEETRR